MAMKREGKRACNAELSPGGSNVSDVNLFPDSRRTLDVRALYLMEKGVADVHNLNTVAKSEGQ
jgi:hypothetical protein